MHCVFVNADQIFGSIPEELTLSKFAISSSFLLQQRKVLTFLHPLLGKSLSSELGIIFTTEKRPAKGALVCSFFSVFIERTSSEHQQLASQHPCLCVLSTNTECVLTNGFVYSVCCFSKD